MSDVGQAKLEDSNMAGYGGEEMRNLRKDAAATDKSLEGAGTKVGMEVWRVENKRTASDTPDFGIARWPKEDYGNFYTGDSYICLNTYNPIDPETKKKQGDKLAWDVHFWLGSETSIDEQGVAAYKTVEIDDLLDDGPVQHREVQGAESRLFQSYFPSITYMEGGIASGFRKVKPEEYAPRLMKVRKTKASVRAIPVALEASAMNHGDAFVLDAGLSVYVWCGDSASPFEKSKAANIAHNIVNSRNGKTKYKKEIDDDFWAKINGSVADVKSAEEAEKEVEPSLDKDTITMFKFSDSSGSLEMTKVAEGSSVKKDLLDSADVFIVASNIMIYTWVGEGASDAERKNAIIKAGEWLQKESGLNKTTPITRIIEGKEPPMDPVWGSMFST